MITVKLIDDLSNDKSLCLIEVEGPAILAPALRREGYEGDESAWNKDVVNDNEVIRDELILLKNLAYPLNSVADMFVAQLLKGTERIKAGDDPLSVLEDLIRIVRFKGVLVIK